MDRIEFVVYGTPAPQGSKSFKGVSKYTGHAVMVESSKAVKPWRKVVKQEAQLALLRAGRVVFDGPLVARMVFTLPKPKSAPKRTRTWPDRKPDVSKLQRSTEDALADAGLIADDARIVEYSRAAKVFPGEDPEALDRPGVRIVIQRLVADDLLKAAA